MLCYFFGLKIIIIKKNLPLHVQFCESCCTDMNNTFTTRETGDASVNVG